MEPCFGIFFKLGKCLPRMQNPKKFVTFEIHYSEVGINYKEKYLGGPVGSIYSFMNLNNPSEITD